MKNFKLIGLITIVSFSTHALAADKVAQHDPEVMQGASNSAILEQMRAMRVRLHQLEQQVRRDDSTNSVSNRASQGNAGRTSSPKGSATATNADLPGRNDDLSNIKTSAGSVNNEDVYKQVKNLNEKVNKLENKTGQVHFGAAFRFNYALSTYNESQKGRVGDFSSGIFAPIAYGTLDNIQFFLEYRFYDNFRTFRQGWIGYNFDDNNHVELGVTKVPFGLLPFPVNNFIADGLYLLGFGDDYDTGLKYVGQYDRWDYRFAFFKNDEGSGNDRYSVDPVALQPQGGSDFGKTISETNTVNGRIAYTFPGNEGNKTEFGVSAQYGGIYDETRNESYGDLKAGAVHYDGQYGRWGVQLEQLAYKYDLDGNEDVVGMGFFSQISLIPAKASATEANISYTLPIKAGPLDKLKFYNDLSYIYNKSSDFKPTTIDVLGARVSAGDSLFVFFELQNSKNKPFANGSFVGDSQDYEQLFNIHIGFYF